jgi:3'-5' exoribonuclease
MPSPRAWIKHLRPAEFIEGVFAIQNNQLAQTKGGKPYIKCLLADKTGRTAGRMWNVPDGLHQRLPVDGFVRVEGQSQAYQGQMQIIINRMEAYDPSADELTELLPSTERDVDQMFRELLGLLQSIEDPAVRALRDAYLGDGDLMDKLCQAPAATALHHAFLGGLLEHTLTLMQAADRLLPLYPQLSRDVILFGLFLHDLGKTRELHWKRGFSYSDEGQLVGHIARGVTMLHDKLAEVRQAANDDDGLFHGDAPPDIPDPLVHVLEHIILSHHGQPEFGAAKLPSTPEAIFISGLDNLDAKINLSLGECCRDAPNEDEQQSGNFTEKIWALGTRLYRPDPTAGSTD